MNDRTESFKKRIANCQHSLDLIEERISEYVLPTDVPLDLKKAKEAKENELESLQKELQSTPSQCDIPSLLPYMPDRTDQDDALKQSIKQLNHERPRPVVCLIHGDEHQCHDMFIQRLLDKSLPLMLYLGESDKVEPYCFFWPGKCGSKQQFHEKLELSLLTALSKTVKCQGSQPWATQEPTAPATADINLRFASHKAPVFLYTNVMTEDWFEDMLMWFLEFWQKWPSLIDGQRLFVCWVMKYKVKKSLTFRLTNLFNNPNRKIKEILETPGSVEQRSFDRIICTVMPELKDITHREAEDWARDIETRAYCSRKGILLEDVLSKISSIYETWERNNDSKAISMAKLAKQLRNEILT
jgi:hypothetical protein